MKKITCPKCEAPNPVDAINCINCRVNFSLEYPEFFKRREELSWIASGKATPNFLPSEPNKRVARYCYSCGKEIQANSVASFCVYCGADLAILNSHVQHLFNKEIHEVEISFKQSNGEYPTYYFISKVGAVGLMLNQNTKKIKEWWDPPHFSHDHLRKLLLKEINQYLSKGWQLVEEDLTDLYIVETGSGETIGSSLSGLIGLPTGVSWKHWWRYLGARFHIQQTG